MKRLFATAIIFISLTTSAYGYCFEEAGRMYAISPLLLWAIGNHESGFRPDAINWNVGHKTYDYGVMQINSSWAKTLGLKTWMSLSDPCTNVKVGAWILSDCIQRYGNTWEAVGCYNATSAPKRARYAHKIYDVLKQVAAYKQ